MLSVKIDVDTKGVLSGLDRLSAQVPYALSRAINQTLKGSQADIRGTLPGSFTLRRKLFVERTVKITRFAKKTDQVGVLAVDPTRDFLAKFEEGGEKKALTGKALSVPLVGGARPTEARIVPARLRLKALAIQAVRTRAGKVRWVGKDGTYILKGARNTVVLQRRGRGPAKALYVFKRNVPIPKALGFIPTATKGIDHRWPFEMQAAFEAAVRTAR